MRVLIDEYTVGLVDWSGCYRMGYESKLLFAILICG